MAKLTEKNLIGQIKELKEIKPRKEWAVLLKSEILSPKPETNPKFQIPQVSKFGFRVSNFFLSFSSKRLAYSFAAFAFIVAGLIGFAQTTVPGDLLFPIKKISEQSTAALSGKTALKQEVATLNNRINDLAQVAKQGKSANVPSAISEITANVSALTKNLKDNPTDSETLKEIASGLKVLASVPGTDMSENSEVMDLYQIIVESQIADLEKSTLTEDQQKTLDSAKKLCEEKKYSDALEGLLLIDKNK